MTLFFAAAPGLRLRPPANTETHHLPTSGEMARAATLENVGEAAGGASGPLPHRHPGACRSFLHSSPNNHHQNGQQNRQEQANLPTPPPSPPGQRGAISGEQSDQRQRREATRRRAHLPDAPPRDGRPAGGGPLPGREATLEARRVDTAGVARQLRTIGDQLNSSVLRAHDAPHWQDWIDAGRGFLNLAARTLSALYRMA
ncbi:bcl-2-binding component 3 [Phyllopteryx taeniolatus]|uniref:bcl-2-binding component 3 n=1 Tax=Phyllopteryx taeniolatus TaxID=161469 RepID=UPI002AD3B7AF|nr:bcl-2-binding component 3 [Phyllopteryx taeniolatus]